MSFEYPKPEESKPEDGYPVSLFGWDFMNMPLPIESDGVSRATLRSLHRLPNPESPGFIYAYKNYRVGSPGMGIEYAAAWLIAHWFEHLFATCACLNNGESGRFRFGVIETLMAKVQ